jgi:hypothetical protein
VSSEGNMKASSKQVQQGSLFPTAHTHTHTHNVHPKTMSSYAGEQQPP